MEIVKQLNGQKFPTLICLRAEVLAKISALPESVQELWGAEADLFGSISVAYEKNNQDILFGKTLKDCLVLGEDLTSPTFSLLFPKVGILFGGKFSTPKISVSLKTGKGYSLSDVLETKVPKKYFLSQKIQDRLKLWERQSEKKTQESGNKILFTPTKESWGGLRATDYKQPPQILVKGNIYPVNEHEAGNVYSSD